MTGYETIISEVKEHTGIITMNRPEVMNAVNERMLHELNAALDAMAADENVRVVVLKAAASRAFCAGADIKESRTRDLAQQKRFVGGLIGLTRKVEGLPKPVIAAVSGLALGAGFELILSCDLIIATADTAFGSPEVNIGLIPMMGGTQRLPRLIGRTRAKEYLFTGERITASAAREMGLVNQVVATPEELEQACTELAGQLAEKAPLALMQLKLLVNKGFDLPLDAALSFEHEAATLINVSEDKKEGQRAFVEKRKPQFKGR